MAKFEYEAMEVGDAIAFGPYHVSREEIISFASEFDPAPFHLDDKAAENSMLGKLSASGWHICSMTMKMMCDAYLLNSGSQGSPGIGQCKWMAPVFADDTLSGQSVVISKRVSKSRPGIGLVELRHEVFKQDGSQVLEMTNSGIVKLGEAP